MDIKLDLKLAPQIDIEKSFAGAYLPKMSAIAIQNRDVLQPFVAAFRYRWPVADKVLALLAPEFWIAIQDFHDGIGDDMMELLGEESVRSWDEWLVYRLDFLVRHRLSPTR